MNQEINAECSLCWKCKFGLCVQETENEHLATAVPHGKVEPEYQIFDTDEPEEFDGEIVEHVVEHKRVKAICYWKPEGIEHTPPILVANVKQCNRFKEQ